MTYAATLTAAPGNVVEFVLLISGIPVAFGTKHGTVVDTSTIYPGGAPASLTTVDALVLDSINIGGLTLNRGVGIVPPSGGSLKIRKSELQDASQWNKYFERRWSTNTELLAAIAEDATSATVVSSSGFAVSTPCFIDGEGILVGGVSAGTLSSLTRNYAGLPGTRSEQHFAGASTSINPRRHKGTIADLYVIQAGQRALVRRFVVDSVKDGGDGTWAISFKDCMSLFDRKVSVGLKPYAVTYAQTQWTTGVAYLVLQVANGPLPSAVPSNLWALVQVGDLTLNGGKAFFAQVTAISGFSVYLSVAPDMIGEDPTAGHWFDVGDRNVTLSLCVRFNGSPMEALLQMALSERGDGDNDATYDVLWGRTPVGSGSGTGDTLASYDEEVRFGAGIPAALVDTATLGSDQYLSARVDGWDYIVGLEELNFLDVAEEVFAAMQGFGYINTSGQLSFKRYAAVNATTASAATVTADHAEHSTPLDPIDDESEVVHTITIDCNYDPVAQQFLGQVNIRNARTWQRYRNVGTVLKMQRRGLLLDLPGEGASVLASATNGMPGSLGALEARYNRIISLTQQGLRKYNLVLPWRFHQLLPGDVITVTHEALNAFDGSGVGLSAQKLEVCNQGALDLKAGTVTFECQETWSGKLLSPVAKVESWAGSTLTLNTSNMFHAGATPGRWFADGWVVQCLDKSASPPFSGASGNLTITSHTDTTITVSGTPAFTPAAGDLLTQTHYDNATSTAENVAEGINQQGYPFQADANFRLGSGDAAGDKWS